MTMQKQIGLMLDLIFDVATRSESPAKKQQMIMTMIEQNERLEEPFLEFISWFKVVESEEDEPVQP